MATAKATVKFATVKFSSEALSVIEEQIGRLDRAEIALGKMEKGSEAWERFIVTAYHDMLVEAGTLLCALGESGEISVHIFPDAGGVVTPKPGAFSASVDLTAVTLQVKSPGEMRPIKLLTLFPGEFAVSVCAD